MNTPQKSHFNLLEQTSRSSRIEQDIMDSTKK